MIAPTQIRKPENWQDFEKLCKKLWGEIWGCSDTIQLNGRSGQNQCGVDVYGLSNDNKGYYGIQCKGKDDYTKSELTIKEIDDEIEKAKHFKPKLKRLIFATTANKDAKIEEYIREKNLEHITNGLFEVYISSWKDIVDKLEEHRSTYNWYINNCQYKDSSDVAVCIDGKDETIIYPQYIRTTTTYSLKPKSTFPGNIKDSKLFGLSSEQWDDLNNISKFQQYGIEGPPREKDYRWCTVSITIKNTGNTVLENYKLYLTFEAQTTENINSKYAPYNSRFGDQAAIAQINATSESKREVYISNEYWNVIEFRPKDQCLVQTDSKTFKIGIKPKDVVDNIKIGWMFKSRDYQKEGELIVKVEPDYEDTAKYIDVDVVEDLKKTAIEITPKII